MAKPTGMHAGATFSVEIDSRDVLEQLARRKFMAQGVYYAAASAAMKEAEKWLSISTNTWRHQPKFTVNTAPPMVEPVYGGIEGDVVGMAVSTKIEIDTTSDIFKFVDRGTKAHAIFPKGPWPLRFQWGGPGSYRAKTGPGHLGSAQGGPTGPIVFRRGVWHPGTKARDFTGKILKLLEQSWPNLVNRAARGK